MSDEPTLKTRADVLDLVIGFIMDHEKQMDRMIGRLERIVERLSRNSRRMESSLTRQDSSAYQPTIFKLSVNNPDRYEKIKSIKIEWETEEKEYTPELSEIDTILDKIEYTFRDKR